MTAVLVAGCLERPRNKVVDGPPGYVAAVDLANKGLVVYRLPIVLRPSVTWMTGECLETSAVDDCFDGLTYNEGDDCEIYLLERSTWADSGFAHEIIHCSIGDPDHEWNSWPGLVRFIRDRLRAAEI